MTLAALKQALLPIVDASIEALQVLTAGAGKAVHQVDELLFAGPIAARIADLEQRLAEKDVLLSDVSRDLANMTEEVERRRKAVAFDGTLVAGLRERMMMLEQCLTSADSTLEAVADRAPLNEALKSRVVHSRKRIKELLPANSPAPAQVPQVPSPRTNGSGAGAGDVLSKEGAGETTASSGTPNPVEPGSIPGRPASEEIELGARWVNLSTGHLANIVSVLPASRQVALKDVADATTTSYIQIAQLGKKWRYLGPLCIAPECEIQARPDGFTCDIHVHALEEEWLRTRLGLKPKKPSAGEEAHGG